MKPLTTVLALGRDRDQLLEAAKTQATVWLYGRPWRVHSHQVPFEAVPGTLAFQILEADRQG